jgi:hypothetical protein
MPGTRLLRKKSDRTQSEPVQTHARGDAEPLLAVRDGMFGK